MVAKLNPRHVLPSRKHFVELEILRLYSEVKEKLVLPRLEEAKHFSITSDTWTSTSYHSFMSFTVHFINSDWTLQSFCLDAVPIFDHTGQNIAHAFREVFQDWNLNPRKLVVTTTDSGRNYMAAFTTLERE